MITAYYPGLTILATVATVFVAVKALQLVYRVTFHPLAKYPGDFLAGLTYKYEFYFDGIRGGRYGHEVAKMHEKYGPIVRVNPDELHCNDPEFIDEVYAGPGRKRHRWTYYTNALGPTATNAGALTADHDLHRLRRSALNRYFSKAAISRLELGIHDLAQLLCDKLLARSGSGEPFNIVMAYSCFTTDVISTYCFGQPHGLLQQPDFVPNIRYGALAATKGIPVLKQWPWLGYILEVIPDAITKRLAPDMAAFLSHMKGITLKVANVSKSWDAGLEKHTEHPTVIHELLGSNLPPREKAVKRLGAEATALVGAGTETTSWVLSVLTVYLKMNPQTLQKLTKELNTAGIDPRHLPRWSALEQLPYLNGVILEGIRLAFGLGGRVARVAPDETLLYEGTFKRQHIKYMIPPGTPVSMTHWMIHGNESVYPQHNTFLPERWLDEDGTRRTNLEKYLLSFSKGTRQCVGMNLAYAELYLAVPALVLRVFPQLELFETGVEDVQFDHETFTPMPKPESEGVRVLVR